MCACGRRPIPNRRAIPSTRRFNSVPPDRVAEDSVDSVDQEVDLREILNRSFHAFSSDHQQGTGLTLKAVLQSEELRIPLGKRHP